LIPGDYWWRVRGIDAQANSRPWSEVRRFTVIAPGDMHQVNIPAGADWARIQDLVQGALDHGGPTQISFAPNATYALDPTLDDPAHHGMSLGQYYCIDLSETHDILVDGNNALLRIIKGKPEAGYFFLKGASNIVIRNLKLEHTRSAYSSLIVKKVHKDTGTVDFEIPTPYPSYDDFSSVYSGHPTHSVPIISPDGNYKFAPSVLLTEDPFVRLGPRLLRYGVSDPEVLDYLVPGDRIVRKSGRYMAGIYVVSVDGLTVNNVEVAADNGCLVLGMDGVVCNKLKILNCRSHPREYGYYHGEPPVFLNSGTVGFWIEKISWDAYNNDDFINTVGARRTGILQVDRDDRRKVTVKTLFSIFQQEVLPGEHLQFYDLSKARIDFETTVGSATVLEKEAQLVLTEPLPGMVQPETHFVFNDSRNCPRFVFRNNEVLHSRSTVVLGTYKGALIENNDIEGCFEEPIGMSRTRAGGLIIRDVMFRKNTIRNNNYWYLNGKSWIVGGGIKINFFDRTTNRMHHDIHIVGNDIQGFGDRVFFIRSARDVYIRDNSISNGEEHAIKSFLGSPNSLIYLENTTRVFFRNNRIVDRRERPASILAIGDSPDFDENNPDMDAQLETENTWTTHCIATTRPGRIQFGDYSPEHRSLSVITLEGQGVVTDGGQSDSFEYACLKLVGDGSITAEIKNQAAVGPQWMGGLMMRERLDPDAPQVCVGLTSAGANRQVQALARAVKGGPNEMQALHASPPWLRLERLGSTVTCSVSPDGKIYEKIRTNRISFSDSIYVGLFCASGSQESQAKVVFDHVRILPIQKTPDRLSYERDPGQ
ncbi:right-handed parallel beta-helix repeat-containing protein, partial [bacterium]|nr:right-handed parallel beta-helix repeat-containing protein [bacterium]